MNTTPYNKQPPAEMPPANCPHAIAAATWAAGEMDDAAQSAYREHLTHCPVCASELAAFQKIVARLRDSRIGEAGPSPDLTERIMAALPPDAFRVTPFSRAISFVRRNRLHVAAAAAVLLATLAAWQLSLRMPVSADYAADAGCDWIAHQQEADGSWDPARGGGSALYRPALTALASLALRRESVRYSKEIAAACMALQQAQGADGAFGADHAGRMYNHALATWALLAACNNGRHPELHATLDKAVAFIRTRQQADGGWGYLASDGEPANTAVTAWQLLALTRAQQAGWDDAGGHLRKGLNWLRQRANDRGEFGYTANRNDASATPTLNAMGAYTLLTAGRARPELVQTAITAMEHLQNARPSKSAPETDLYRAFFTVAAWEASGNSKRADVLRADVCDRRETRGANKGSWAPADNWGKVGGRLYATSLAVLTLQSHAGIN